MHENTLDSTSRIIEMIISSATQQGKVPLPAMAAERLLNASTRMLQGVPTGINASVERDTNQQ